MQADDPPYLSVGTAVSAKYKGAFCEAKISNLVRTVKCKVTFKMGMGTTTVSYEQIKGALRVGHTVQVKHADKKELSEAVITKIQDCSQYTVVFDDGDITTLRRSALCLKSGRHFNESETLDQLPLTHPEHFSNPVVGGRRGRRNRQLKEDSSDGEGEEENEPDLEGYSTDIGRVFCIEQADKKKNKDNWFPAVVVIPSAQPTVKINVKDEYLVRSFKDGRYYTVPKKEVFEFTKDQADKVESSALTEAVTKAVNYLDNNELPAHWERNLLFNMQTIETDSEENFSDSSDDEPNEEKDRFVAQLYKFMDDAGTPLNKSPMIGNKDVDLYRLFRAVHKLGGYNRVTNQNKWRSVTNRLRLPNNQVTYNQVKSVYKKFLFSYENFYRTLGVTMLNHTRSTKKNRGRSLIRDKDRATPVNSPKVVEKEEEEKKEDEKVTVVEEKRRVTAAAAAAAAAKKIEEEKAAKKVKEQVETSETSSGDTTDQSESAPGPSSREVGRPKRVDSKAKDKKVKGAPAAVEKPKVVDNKNEEEKQVQQTRSKSQLPKPKELEKKKEPPIKEKIPPTKPPKKIEEEKKRGRKKATDDKKSSESSDNTPASLPINIGDKLKVYYGPTHESKVTYEAKVIEIDKESKEIVYLVHYTGWNTRYDEWIAPSRVAENLSATTKAKRLRQSPSVAAAAAAASSGTATPSKGTAKIMPATKRGRGMSITGRATTSEVPRSTTPSSVTSSSSRTKSPATPATRSSSRTTRQDYTRTRRISAQTDISIHSESDSESSEAEPEVIRTRSSNRIEEPEVKTYKKKPKPVTNKSEKLLKEKEEAVETEKEDDSVEKVKRPRRIIKKSPEKEEESDEDLSGNPPKGRDFDLNQIRSELKGFNKAIKVPPVDATSDKEALCTSSDDSNNLPAVKIDIEDKKEPVTIEKSPNSEDIYEFKEPEPFEFETRTKLNDDKRDKKRLVTRLFDDVEKSPKRKIIKSPRRTPARKIDESDSDDKKDEDPFDKLVESPSFNIVKNDKSIDTAPKCSTTSILDGPLNLFRELPETVDDYSRDMDLSDTESQTQPIFSTRNELFSDTFTKLSPPRPSLDIDFPTAKNDELKKDTLDFDSIRESINRKIGRNTTSSDDSNDDTDEDLMVRHSVASYQGKKQRGDSEITATIVQPIPVEKTKVEAPPEIKEEPVRKSPIQIDPALQETDSSLLESVVSSQPVSIAAKLEEIKDLNVKTGTKIADSILQKFNSIRNSAEKSPKRESDSEQDLVKKTLSEVKVEEKPKLPELTIPKLELKTKPSDLEAKKVSSVITKIEPISTITTTITTTTTTTTTISSSDSGKKKKKVLSRAYIDESDSDSSDSEQLVIARSDEDSQTNSIGKPDLKESDSNLSSAIQIATTDDSQSQEEPRHFKLVEKLIEQPSVSTALVPKEAPLVVPVAAVAVATAATSATVVPPPLPLPPPPPPPQQQPLLQPSQSQSEPETVKEEDSQLHSLLRCDETLPRSPGPVNETSLIVTEQRPKPKSVLEMPFASVPGSSNNKIVINKGPVKPQPLALVMPIENRDNSREVSTVLDNTPPTTPESTISNLSPRGDHGDLSPNTVENESGKSNDGEPEFARKRRNSSINKSSPFSEDDTQMTSEPSPPKKPRIEDTIPAVCRKRRKSARGPDEAPLKRGRKPLNRSRHNSDSDDTSEHSLSTSAINTGLSGYDRTPRPSKYNFFVEFDPSLNSNQRIAVLQQKLSELRKTYAEVKAELAAVERRRKKIRRREREALKASKQELACA